MGLAVAVGVRCADYGLCSLGQRTVLKSQYSTQVFSHVVWVY